MRTCQNNKCQQLFKPKPGTAGKFCSPECFKEMAGYLARIKADKEDKIKDEEYLLNPKICFRSKCCNTIPRKLARVNKFCSQSCAAITKNTGSKHSEETKQKISNTLEAKYFSKTRISFFTCVNCNTVNYYKTHKRKTCSLKCQKEHQRKYIQSKLSDPNYRKNYGRGKKSYLESSFENWLNGYQIVYKTEVKFKNEKKTYFVDFLFQDKNLIIELDGTQHNTPDRIILDKIRDDYLETLGYKVVRIKHKEYIKQTRLDEIKGLLDIV